MAKLTHFDVLNIKHFVLFVTFIGSVSCTETPKHLVKVQGTRLQIDSSSNTVSTIEEFILPYQNRVDHVLDSTLAYCAKTISKTDGVYNTTAGNFIADLMLEQTQPIFKKRTGKDIDFAMMNHGGIRSIISKGPVSARTAYEVMPFENNISVVELTGKSVRDMIAYLIRSKRAHPLSGIQVVLNSDDSINAINIQGAPFNEDRNYYIATSDYLVTGGDNMVFFKDAITIIPTEYKIRNAMIDYFKRVDTLNPVIDTRYYKLTP